MASTIFENIPLIELPWEGELTVTTLTEKAYDALRHDIVRGHWSPGQQLRMAELSARYGMGFSPLREALSRLQAEGLAMLAPLRGFSVASLSLEEMWDTINLRILIECEALRLSIRKGGDDWEAGIISTLHALNRQSGRLAQGNEDDLWELERRHAAFHLQLISACGSPRLLALAQRLYIDTERYRIPILLQSGPASGRDVQREHTDIADAALARKLDVATHRLTEHYKLTAQAIGQRITRQIVPLGGTDQKKPTAKRRRQIA
jgi:DNA-binding GntR family transcriptional regulator